MDRKSTSVLCGQIRKSADSFRGRDCRVAGKKNYAERTEALLVPILEQESFELVDVEWVKEGQDWFLRAYIDKEGGITIGDCELVSRALEEKLDAEDFISENYILEVSSPGLDRPLKKDRDFARSIGKEVEIRLFKPIDGTKEMTGTLLAYDKDTVRIGLDAEKELEIPRAGIARIRLWFTF